MAKKPDKRRGSGLAARLRATMDRRAAAVEKETEEKAALLEAARKERVSLMADLAAFGKAVGFKVRRPKEKLFFEIGEETVEFDATDENGVVTLVQAEGAKYQYRLEYEHRLARWVLVVKRESGSSERLILFDTGLEFLMDELFDLEVEEEVEEEEVEAPVIETKTPDEPEPKEPRKRSL